MVNSPKSTSSLEGSLSPLALRNFRQDAQGLMPIDANKLAWEYATSPDAHILEVFGKQALEAVKKLPPLERILAASELAINAIHIRGLERYEEQMRQIDLRFDEAEEKIKTRTDAIIGSFENQDLS